jgi:hypothetical protein
MKGYGERKREGKVKQLPSSYITVLQQQNGEMKVLSEFRLLPS